MSERRMWGMTLLPNKKYSRVLEENFRITSASFGVETKPITERAVVQVVVDDNYYVLCSLVPKTGETQLLDLEFYKGQEVCFFVNGSNNVYLSGNVLLLEEEGDDDEEGEDIEYSDEDDEEDDEDIDSDEYAEMMENFLAENATSEEDSDEDSDDGPIIEELSTSEEEELPKANGKAKAKTNGKPEPVAESKKNKNKSKEEDEPRKKAKTAPEAQEKSPAKKEAPKKEAKKQEAPKKEAPKKEAPKQEAPKKEAPKPASNIQKLPNGLILEDKVVGTGTVATKGKRTSMRYIGKLTNGKVFDKCVSGKPFTFRLGVGEVIKGWDLGIAGMKVGGERKLTIPFNLAYGTRGAPPDIPPRADLIFEVKLLDVKK